MSDHINHIKSHQVEIEMPRNAKQLVIGENSLEQSIETDIPVVMRFDSPLTNVSIVLKSRNNVTLLMITVSRVLQGDCKTNNTLQWTAVLMVLHKVGIKIHWF